MFQKLTNNGRFQINSQYELRNLQNGLFFISKRLKLTKHLMYIVAGIRNNLKFGITILKLQLWCLAFLFLSHLTKENVLEKIITLRFY